MRIGVFGGTFDPPHAGHIAFAEAAQSQLALDEVLWVPANRNPGKSGRIQSPARHRLAMVQLATSRFPGFAVSDLEIRRGGASYAVDTLAELSVAQPAEYWFLVGADAARDLKSWKQPDRLLRMCRLAIALRPPVTESDVLSRLTAEQRTRVDLVHMPPNYASATEIRGQVVSGQRPLNLDSGVAAYIAQHGLYLER